MISFAYRRVNIKTGEVYEDTINEKKARDLGLSSIEATLAIHDRGVVTQSTLDLVVEIARSAKAELVAILSAWNHEDPENYIYGPI